MRPRILRFIGSIPVAFVLVLWCADRGSAAADQTWYWQRGPADLVLLHGHVVTMDTARPEAEAVAVTAGRIVAVGSDRDIRRSGTALRSPTSTASRTTTRSAPSRPTTPSSSRMRAVTPSS